MSVLSRGVAALMAMVAFAVGAAPIEGEGDAKVPPEVTAYVAKNLNAAQVLGPAGGGMANEVGFAVAVNDRFAAVGVPAGSLLSASPITGVVYLYERVNATNPFLLRGIVGPNATTDPPQNIGSERFGESVAIFGNTLVVGAPQDTDDPSSEVRVGSAYVFAQATRGGPFQFQGKITASSAGLAVGGVAFGQSVAIAGPHVFVGVPGADLTQNNAGAVAVFTCVRFPVPACTHRTNLEPADATLNGNFGLAVAAARPPKAPNASLLVGAPRNCVGSPCVVNGGEGAAYLYVVPPLGPIPAPSKLTAFDAQTGDRFGHAVSFDGIGAAIGAPMDNAGVGSVRLFFRSPTGVQQGQVLRPGPGITDPMEFGTSVAQFRNHVAVGAPRRTITTPPRIGSVFLFERAKNQWFKRDEVFRTAGFGPLTSDVGYGRAVALGGGVLMSGEPLGPGATGGTQGRVYVYLTGRGAKIDRIGNPGAAPDADNYGTDVAIAGGFMAVGLPNRDIGATAKLGEVRLYQQAAGGGAFLPTSQAFLTFPETPVPNARFGHAIAFTRNAQHLIVGAPGAFNGTGNGGAVFVYERRGSAFQPFTQDFKLVRTGGVAGEDFGASLDASPSANLLIVGAPNADQLVGGTMMTDVGAVTIFRDPAAPPPESGKVGQLKFEDGDNVPPPSGGGIGDKWGSSVATDGDQAVAGAPEPGADTGDGYATVIDDGGTGSYGNTDTMTPPADAGGSDEQDFGSSVDIDDGTAAVGAPGTDVPDEDLGSTNADEGTAYAYDVTGGSASEPSTLDQPGGGVGDKWGSSVAVDDEGVGAGGPGTDVPTDTGTSTDQGAVSTYECYVNELGLVICEHDETLYGKNATSDEAIGSSIDMEDGEIVLGAPDAGATDEGAVYVSEDLFPFDGLFRDGYE